MPLRFIHYPEPFCQIAIWEMTEKSNQLVHSLSQIGIPISLPQLLAENRKKEKLSTLLLISELLGQDKRLSYNKDGKPELEGTDCAISISHCRSWLGIALHKKKRIGLDLEQRDERTLRILSKYASESEIKSIREAKDPILESCFLWSAKESLYKWYAKKQLAFKDNLTVKWSLQGEQITGSGFISKDDLHHELEVHAFGHQDILITFCTEKENLDEK